MLIFFFFASALSALHFYNEPKFMVIGNPIILKQSHAHNAPDLWDRGSTSLVAIVLLWRTEPGLHFLHAYSCRNSSRCPPLLS